jgi:ABC-type amino acid transport substrate-binding protein
MPFPGDKKMRVFEQFLPALEVGQVVMVISGMTMTQERNLKVDQLDTKFYGRA